MMEKKKKIVNAYLNLFNQLKDIGLSSVVLDEGAVGVGSSYISDSLFCVLKDNCKQIRYGNIFEWFFWELSRIS